MPPRPSEKGLCAVNNNYVHAVNNGHVSDVFTPRASYYSSSYMIIHPLGRLYAQKAPQGGNIVVVVVFREGEFSLLCEVI